MGVRNPAHPRPPRARARGQPRKPSSWQPRCDTAASSLPAPWRAPCPPPSPSPLSALFTALVVVLALVLLLGRLHLLLASLLDAAHLGELLRARRRFLVVVGVCDLEELGVAISRTAMMGRPDDGRRRSSSRGVGRGGGCRRVRDADAAEHGGGGDDRRLRGPADGGSRVDAPLDDCHPARGPAEAGGIHARGVVGSVVGSVGGGGDERAGPPRAGSGAPGARTAAQRGTAAGATGPRAVPFAGRWAIEAWRAPAPVAAPAASIARVALMVQFASSLPRCAIRPRLPRIRAALRAESRGCCGS